MNTLKLHFNNIFHENILPLFFLMRLFNKNITSAKTPLMSLQHVKGIRYNLVHFVAVFSLLLFIQNTIALLITDIVMPNINGSDLAKQLLSTHKEMKCLFMSGYTADVIAQHGILDEGVNFLSKPFERTEFVQKVREILDS